MMRSLAAACFLAALAGPAMAQASFPPPKPDQCSSLGKARADARVAAVARGYEVRDLDGEAAHAFAVQQGVPARLLIDHATVMTDRGTGRRALLINDGPACAFGTIATDDGTSSPIELALGYLRTGR